MRREIIPSKVPGFTGVARIQLDPDPTPFKAQARFAPGWRTVGQSATQAGAEAIAKGYRIDHRGAVTRVKEQRRERGVAYIAV